MYLAKCDSLLQLQCPRCLCVVTVTLQAMSVSHCMPGCAVTLAQTWNGGYGLLESWSNTTSCSTSSVDDSAVKTAAVNAIKPSGGGGGGCSTESPGQRGYCSTAGHPPALQSADDPGPCRGTHDCRRHSDLVDDVFLRVDDDDDGDFATRL